MASVYTNDLRLEEIGSGEQSGTWGDTTNTNLELIAEAFSFGTETITTNADTHTTTIADGATDPGRSMFLKYTGTLDSACTITIAPNTVSKLWFIENGTSGSQNILISQGSGANITIPPGDTKAIYSDGAGSGAAMVDAFASLSVVDLKVQDDLTVTDDVAIGGLATVGGTLGVTGIATFTDDIIIGDGKTIGSASDVDAITIAANGQVTLTQTLIGTALDISGDIDVDGTTNLDVVDIDGAVDMASTLAVAGVVTANAGVVVDNITIDGTEIDLSSGNLTIDVAGYIILNSDADGLVAFSDAAVDFGLIKQVSSNFVIEAGVSDKDILFKGQDAGATITALTLDMSDAGRANFNSDIGLLDNSSLRFGTDNDASIFHTGSAMTVANATGNLTLDVAGRIILDAADNGIIQLQEAGTAFGEFFESSGDFNFYSNQSNKDIIFKGNDGGSTVTALTLDMSNAGAATFNKKIIVSAADGVAANDYVGSFTNLEGTSGQSFGVSITAGSSGSDIALNVVNTAGDTVLMRVHGNGTTTIGSGLTLTDGNLVVAAGHGIDFAAQTPSSATGASTGSELLDHYEEGTWTPTLASGGAASLASGSAKYTRIGSTVTVTFYLTSINPTADNALFKIGGVPFTPAANAFYGGQMAYSGQNDLQTMLPIIGDSGAFIYFENQAATTAANTNNMVRALGLTGESADSLIVSMTYFV